MKNAQSILQVIEQQKKVLRSHGLLRVGVFGSVIRGEEKERSDIDILLDFDPKQKTYRNFLNSTETLEKILKRPVDAVTTQGLSPYIKPYVDREVQYVEIA